MGMNENFIPCDWTERFVELTEVIQTLRDCSTEEAELMASKVLSRAYSSTYLVRLTDGGRCAVYQAE